jgi:predicted transposase YbfD/YdcC
MVETLEYGHGRSERRHYSALYDQDFLVYLNQDERGNDRGWQIKSVIRVERKRQVADTLEHKVHYYISSLPGQDAHLLADCIRSHWGIENGAHWILDVTFREDHCRVRTGFGPENLAGLRHMALNFLKRETSSKKSVNRKRFAAALDPDYLLKILQASTDTSVIPA